MALEVYKQKRNFLATPEPRGALNRRRKSRRFVVQEHHATHLHWDLRLEMGGVLKSWAVPKGIPMQEHVKRLAIMTEDHPVEYLGFQGTIPQGSYGAGKMGIWDSGTYDLVQTGNPETAVSHGKLSIEFHGDRMDGFWEMVKTDDKENHWLLFKVERDGEGLPNERHAAKRKSAHEPVAEHMGPTAQMPSAINPMLATASPKPFSDPEWIYEIKWDGYRALCYLDHGKQRLVSRNQLPLDNRFPELSGLANEVECETAVIDGEIVGLDADGKPRFQLLQNRGRRRTTAQSPAPEGTLVYYAFDLLYLNGASLMAMPLVERKHLLENIIHKDGRVRYSDHVVGAGIELFKRASASGLEGVMAKQAQSPYIEGRSERWRKIKAVQTADVVIGGYTNPSGNRANFGALLLGLYGPGGLVGVGRAGSGFDQAELARVHKLLEARTTPASPFVNLLPGQRDAHWVRPDLVCEVKFSEMTDDGFLRHPTYLGLREDKNASECTFLAAGLAADATAKGDATTRSRPSAESDEADRLLATSPRPENATVTVDGAAVSLTHLNKVFWPATGRTKGDLIAYYDVVSNAVLPYLRDRPLILQRYPNGVDAAYFFQHDVKQPPPFAQTFTDPNLAHDVDYLICNNKATLLYIANLGVIPLHPLPIRRQSPHAPDWIVFDLDPEPDAPFESVCKLALDLRDVLGECGLVSFAKTSGSAGMHVYVPTDPLIDFDGSVHFALAVAHIVQRRRPGLVTLERMTRKRKPAEIYLDCLQNAAGKSVAGPYSARATAAATVSTPLSWAEVERIPNPAEFTIDTVPARLGKGDDPWAGMLGLAQSIASAVDKLQRLAAADGAAQGGHK